jgi:glutathione synthase/RimK-type ligase-like ATP-grasp enzyme
MKLGILKSWENIHLSYIDACEELKINYEVIDILSPNWIGLIKKSNCDGFLCRPPCDLQERKTIYDEKLYFMTKFMNKKIYPSYDELFIYENKRNMSYFLEIENLPHPKTFVFSRKEDALYFIEKCTFPQVFKTNIGAGASGVIIVKSKREAKSIINKVFGRFHKYFAFGKIHKINYKNFNFPNIGGAQKHYLIAQEFHNINYEWRIIKIGNSYSGHQKLLDGKFASGSGLVGWYEPPKELLELVKNIADKYGFYSVSIDIFETENNKFLINEIQSLFGSYLKYQMKIDNIPGIFKYEKGNFVFYKGEFHQNSSNNLRIKHFVDLLENEK